MMNKKLSPFSLFFCLWTIFSAFYSWLVKFRLLLATSLLFLISVDAFAGTPVMRSALGAGATITINYDTSGSSLDSAFVPAASCYTFTKNGGVPVTINSVEINSSAQTVSLRLNSLINMFTDSDMMLTYDASTCANAVRDTLGNQVAGFSTAFVAKVMPTFDVNGNALIFISPICLTGGNCTTSGSKILFNNLITIDGQAIDAVVTITFTGGTINGTDTVAGGTPAPALTGGFFSQNWFTLRTTAAANVPYNVNFEFIKGGSYGKSPLTSSTGDDVILENVALNSYDLDNCASCQYQDFGGFATFSLSTTTKLTQTQPGTVSHFLTSATGDVTLSPGTATGDDVRVQALYESIHSFFLQTGATGAGLAYYYLDFSRGPAWATALPPTYEIPTVNKKTTNDTTPDLSGTFVGTVGNSTDTAWQLKIEVWSVAPTPPATTPVSTLVPTHTYTTTARNDVGNIATISGNGITATFDKTTGIGTWTITDPTALALATYDVKATVYYGANLTAAKAASARTTVDNTINELIINGAVPDTTRPTLTSIERLNPLGQNITPAALAAQSYVDFKVTFSEAVDNIDKTDFAITGAGSTGSTLSSVIQSGTNTYTVRISNIPPGNLGILDLNLLVTNDLIDLAGNLLDICAPAASPCTADPEGVVPTSGIDETYIIAGVDYGDAPDTGAGMATGNYRTLATDSGPSHIVTATLKLGATVNADNGTLQNAAANADTSDDGVASFNAISTATTSYSVDVSATNSSGSSATLHGWIDFNKNGNFEAGEYASVIVPDGASSSVVTLTWNSLSGLTVGDTYLRLRLAPNAELTNASGNTGVAGNGEIEDYRLTIIAAPYDYGDAPSGGTVVETVGRNYGSASHATTTTTIYLGTTAPDTDTAANQTTWQGQTTANGDDSVGTDEGIAQLLSGAPSALPVLTSAATDYSLTLVCRGSATANAVSGWIDFNKNGTFEAGERAQGTCSSGTSTAGTVTLTWSSLTGLKTGSTFARFRMAGNATESSVATGTAADGEVEDYPIAIRTAVKIIKKLSPTTDAGKFNLTVSGGNPATPTGSNNPMTDAVNNGTTGFIAVDAAGAITVQETAGTATSLANYTTTVSCTQGDGTTAIAPAPTTTLTGATRSGVFTAPALGSTGTAAQVICTFTNTRMATLQLKKTWAAGSIAGDQISVTTTGGTNNASITNSTATAAGNTDTGTAVNVVAGDVITLPAETFNVGNSSDYTTTLSCTGNTTALVGNALTVNAADTAIVCTYTNAPTSTSLIINKTTVGGYGSFDFTITNGTTTLPVVSVITTTGVGNNPKSSAVQPLAETGVTTVTETQVPGWTITSGNCTDGTTTWNAVGNKVTIPAVNLAKTYTCDFTNTHSGFTISGNVFKDIGTNIAPVIDGVANDGIKNGSETGLQNVIVKLTNCAEPLTPTDIYATTITDSAGNYSLAVSSAPAGPVCVEETNLSGYVSTGAYVTVPANFSGYVKLNDDKQKFTLAANTSYSGVNFGDIPANQFLTDGTKTGLPGTTLTYPHTFIAATSGTVTFSTSATASPAIAAWSEVLYRDLDCSGTLTTGDTPLSAPVSVSPGSRICLIQKEFIPANAPLGARNVVVVQATFVGAGTLVYTRQDVTHVTDTALDLQKLVCNLTTPTSPPCTTSNTAKSGEKLEYQVTYTNNGKTAIGNIVVNDATPGYTKFDSAACGALPNNLLSCNPVTPSIGGTGAIQWTFTGSLAPGASGTVIFRVIVD